MFGNHGKLGIEVNWWTQIIWSTAAVIPLPWTGFRVKVFFLSGHIFRRCWQRIYSFTLLMLIGCQASEVAIQGEIYKGFCMKIYNRVYWIYKNIESNIQIYKWNVESNSNNYFNLVWNIGLAAYSPPETFNSTLRPLDECFWDHFSRLIFSGCRGGGAVLPHLPAVLKHTL